MPPPQGRLGRAAGLPLCEGRQEKQVPRVKGRSLAHSLSGREEGAGGGLQEGHFIMGEVYMTTAKGWAQKARGPALRGSSHPSPL